MINTVDKRTDAVALIDTADHRKSDKRSQMSSNWMCLVPFYLLPFLPGLHEIGLRRLPVFGVMTEKPLSQFKLYGNLKTLTIFSSRMNRQDLARLLTWFPSLTHLRLWDNGSSVVTDSVVVPRRYLRMAPTLESLLIEDANGIGNLLDMMASSGWPSLRTVRCLRCVCSSTAVSSRLDGMLRQCTSSLEILHITFWTVTLPGERARIMRGWPHSFD